MDRIGMSSRAPGTESPAAAPVTHLSTTDKYLPVWIGAAMVGDCCSADSSPAWVPGWGPWRSTASRCRSLSGCS
ncbi:hypothetical protein GCM10009584_03450 [Ornithinimicrobium humiphilum]